MKNDKDWNTQYDIRGTIFTHGHYCPKFPVIIQLIEISMSWILTKIFCYFRHFNSCI